MNEQTAFLFILGLGVMMALFTPCWGNNDVYDHHGNRIDDDH